MLKQVQTRLHARSLALLEALESGLPKLLIGWFTIAVLASAARLTAGPAGSILTVPSIAPYYLLVIAPIASIGLALHWFADGGRLPQPKVRLAVIGRWRTVSSNDAERHPLYGPSGLMVSLLVGLLLNIPVRAAEYLAAMPALGQSVPGWLRTLQFAMTFDLVLLTSLYAIAFVAALRCVPLFPRLLGAIWAIDIAMQLLIAEMVAGAEGLPVPVAHSLQKLLEGNITKVLVSAAIWLPYLLLSSRVNVTYRSRVPA